MKRSYHRIRENGDARSNVSSSNGGHGVGLIVDADNRGDLDAAHLRGIDVALEFTTPATAYDNIRACIDGRVRRS